MLITVLGLGLELRLHFIYTKRMTAMHINDT